MSRSNLQLRRIRWFAAVSIGSAAAVSLVQAATVTWKTAVSGNWDDGSKWSTGAMPAAGDTVIINASGTYAVTVNVATSPGALTLDAATGTATLTVSAGSLTMNGPGTVGPGGHLRLDSGSLGGTGDITASRFTWSGGQIEGAGRLTFPAGAVVDVMDGGQHNLRDRTIVNGNYSALILV